MLMGKRYQEMETRHVRKYGGIHREETRKRKGPKRGYCPALGWDYFGSVGCEELEGHGRERVHEQWERRSLHLVLLALVLRTLAHGGWDWVCAGLLAGLVDLNKAVYSLVGMSFGLEV